MELSQEFSLPGQLSFSALMGDKLPQVVVPGELSLKQVAEDKSHPHQEPAEMCLMDQVVHHLHVSELLQTLMELDQKEYASNRSMSSQEIQRRRLMQNIRNNFILRKSRSEHPGGN
jgi:hypothetical protein